MSHVERITEYVASQPGRVDRELGVITNVKVLGTRSKNGWTYPADTITAAVGLYEGCRVNIDHPNQQTEQMSRNYSSKIGVLRRPRVSRDGLRADLHINPKHPLAEQVMWDAQHAPESLGLSHVANVRFSRGGKTIVEEITRVHSVDIVAKPATTMSLFESEGGRWQVVDRIAEQLHFDVGPYPALRESLMECDSEAKIRATLEDWRSCEHNVRAETHRLPSVKPTSREQRLVEGESDPADTTVKDRCRRYTTSSLGDKRNAELAERDAAAVMADCYPNAAPSANGTVDDRHRRYTE